MERVNTDSMGEAEQYARYAKTNIDNAEPKDQQALEWAKALALTSIAFSLAEINAKMEWKHR